MLLERQYVHACTPRSLQLLKLAVVVRRADRGQVVQEVVQKAGFHVSDYRLMRPD